MSASILQGSRVYLKNAVAGEPGVVHEIDRRGYASVEWVDVPEIGRWLRHHVDTLVVDEAFTVRQLDLFSLDEELAA